MKRKKLHRSANRERLEKVASLDRKWNRERERYYFRAKNGMLLEPTESGALMIILLGGMLGAFLITWGSWWTAIGGIVVFCGCFFAAMDIHASVERYQRRIRKYAAEREKLMRRASEE